MGPFTIPEWIQVVVTMGSEGTQPRTGTVSLCSCHLNPPTQSLLLLPMILHTQVQAVLLQGILGGHCGSRARAISGLLFYLSWVKPSRSGQLPVPCIGDSGGGGK